MAFLKRWAPKLLLLIALVLAGKFLLDLVHNWLDTSILPHTEGFVHRAIIGAIAIYTVLLAIPFVPGAEIGLTLLTVLGSSLAPLVYISTATGLMIAYFIGRFIPAQVLQVWLSNLGLYRAAEFVQDSSELTEEELENRISGIPMPKFLKALIQFRYVTLLILINLPGNAIIGGGGGIALMAGLSRCYAPLPFLLTVLIAVLPIPLLFFIGRF